MKMNYRISYGAKVHQQREELTIEFEEFDLIETLKQKIEDQTKIPCYQQVIIYAGKILQDSHTVVESKLGSCPKGADYFVLFWNKRLLP
jgi:Ubiquitin family